MSIIRWIRISIIVMVVLLAACGGTPSTPTPLPEPTATMTPEPSDTPEPTASLVPTATNTSEPTNTPEPTPTFTPEPTNTVVPTAVPALEMGERELLAGGGFSFQPAMGYEVDSHEGQIFMSDEAGTIMISIIGIPDFAGVLSSEVIIDEFLAELSEVGNGTFVQGDSLPISIDGIEGTVVALTGDLFNSPIEGQAFFVQPGGRHILFGVGISNLHNNEDLWHDVGQPVFTALLDSIVFEETAVTQSQPEVEVPTDGKCTMAMDATYGYTEDNPIQVGGDAWDGPPRERAFFDNLLGPNGETITYTRGGSLPYGDTILDTFSVSYPGIVETAVIYVDEYTYSAPMVPLGFTCIAEFPLSAP